MCQKGGQPKPLLTPEQRQAAQALLNYASGGQRQYLGDFNITPDILSEFLGSFSQGTTPGFDPSSLREIYQTGAPFTATEQFAKQREVAQTAAQRAAENVLAQMAQAGAKYSTPALRAATRAAGEVQSQAELGILQQMAQEHAATQARKLQAAQLLIGAANQAASMGLDAARLQMAANQFTKGMQYEEFKRLYPDVYQLLQGIWGRNVDFYMKRNPNYVGAALTIIGGIVGAIASGGTMAPLIGASIGASIGGQAGSYFGG